MKQPSQVPVYTETDKQRHAELRFQLRQKNNLMDELEYNKTKGTIDNVEFTKKQVQILMEYNVIRKEMIWIIK